MHLPFSLACLLVLLLPANVESSPLDLQQQIVLEQASIEDFNLFHHMSGISPYFKRDPTVNMQPPEGCQVVSAAYYIRHADIYANDDEYEESMGPFLQKLYKWQSKNAASKRKVPEQYAFLNDWKSPINDSVLEDVTPHGGQSSLELGQRLSKVYANILPKSSELFELWAADASRDISTARAFLKGLLPDHHGGDGSGDGHVKLVKVSTNDPTWSANLTPHKICKDFSKKKGRPERKKFEKKFTKSIRKRMKKVEGLKDLKLSSADVVGMFQLCGYESSAMNATSPFCRLFTREEFEDFEYSNDLHYHYMLGYGSKIGPYLGFPWLETANKKLHEAPIFHSQASDGKLPNPSHPPNGTVLQAFSAYLTHREEPPCVLVALGLLKDEGPLSDKHIVKNRQWQTSKIIPFLGHIGLERMTCANDLSFVRAIVNESPIPLRECQDGPGRSCSTQAFHRLLAHKKELYSDIEDACNGLKT